MLKLLVVGLGLGIGLQAWRNFPPDGPVSADAAGLFAVLGMLAAYLAGRARRRFGSATATATATASSEALAAASAQQQLQVVINNGQSGAQPLGVTFPDERTAPWLVTAEPRPALTLDDLDGVDVAELHEQTDYSN